MSTHHAPTKARVPSSSGALDLLHARVAFRDRRISDVLDLALRFLVVHGRSYAKVALVTLVPLLALALLAGWQLGWVRAWAVSLPFALALEVPFTVLASRLVFRDAREVATRDVVRDAMREVPRVLFVRGMATVLTILGLFVIVVPGVWLATLFLFLSEVMLLERATVAMAFGRAQRVASAASSETVLGVFVLTLLPIAGVLLADVAGRAMISELFQFRPPSAVWSEGGGALATIGLFAQVPYLATARFFLYLNVRTRAEGWDIQTRFAAIAARAAQPDPGAT